MIELEQILNYKGWIVGVFFIILISLEHLLPVVQVGFNPVWRIIKNLSFWPINIGLSLLVILPFSHFAADHVLWQRPDWWSGGPGLMLDVIILDLFLYFWHRAVHEVPFFWRFHEVHHLDKHLDTTSAIRFHFGEIFLATVVRVFVILLFGLPFSSVVLFETVVLVGTLFHHSNVALPAKVENLISKIIVTPSIHWVHHHAIRKDTDSNYSTLFSFWDHLFNTRSETQRYENMEIGVEGLKEKSFAKLLIRPFTKK